MTSNTTSSLIVFLASTAIVTLAAKMTSSSSTPTKDCGDGKDTTPIVICGPSGVGKGTLIDLLMKKYSDGQFGFSVSHTTRNPREGEVDGVHYNFTTVEAMKSAIEAGEFVEYAEVHGRYYGTSIKAVESVKENGQICILDIDIQGVQAVKKSSLSAHYLFVAPPEPALKNLEARLRGRGTEKEEDLQRRLAQAKNELDYGFADGNFDTIITNDNLDEAFARLVDQVKQWHRHL